MLLGIRLANEGFAALAVTQPALEIRRSSGFCRPKNACRLGARATENSPGELRGPGPHGHLGLLARRHAASLLALELEDVKAAFLARHYDFKRAYETAPYWGPQNMKDETHDERSIIQRSSILRMERLKCPVLVLHGGKDINVPSARRSCCATRLTQLIRNSSSAISDGNTLSARKSVTSRSISFTEGFR